MQYANIILALAGDSGNTVPKRGVSAAEIAVLMAIHGEAAVSDIEPTDERPVSNRSELARLRNVYGRAKDGDDTSIVDKLFPGAAARVFETLDEIDIDESFFKAETRKVAPAPVKKADPLDHDGDGRKGGSVSAAPSTSTDPLDSMTKAQLVEHAEKAGVEIDPRDNKASILEAIRIAEATRATQDSDTDDDGVEDIDDGAKGENLFK